MPLTPVHEDIDHRRPVWLALSDLFLDTDTSLSRESRVRVLSQSPYSIEALERILVEEVSPACCANLLSVAGEWAGFDIDWLQARILRRARSPIKALYRFHPGSVAVRTSAEWRATRRAVEATRAAARHGAS